MQNNTCKDRIEIAGNMEAHIHDTPELIPICEKHLRQICPYKERCPEHHSPLPYLWQVCLDWRGWVTLKLEECEFIEKKFCSAAQNSAKAKIALPDPSDKMINLDVIITFCDMHIAVKPEAQPNSQTTHLPVRRLSTMTFVKAVGEKKESVDDPSAPKYCTQWRWYFEDPAAKGTWQPFEQNSFTPMQWTMEDKFESGQEMYRFEVMGTGRGAEVILINFPSMKIANPKRQQVGPIRRRPLFLGQQDLVTGKCLSYPPRKTSPFHQNIPSNWFPLDPRSEFELVPLNPDSLECHLVTSELVRSLPKDRKIFDVFRLQNAFLWHKYHSKKMILQHKGVVLNELQLFHGTGPEAVVQAIFRQNFDPRVAGRNMIMYGKGSYFARDASYSDKYTGSPGPGQFRWMFLARVLTGRYTKGNPSYVRPPPVDATNPHSDLFDSCVDNEGNPRIYVIFDNDQVYPEYVISYR